jgi:hypothetical protein
LLFLRCDTQFLKVHPIAKEEDMKTLKAMASAAVAGALLIGAAATAQGATLDTTTATPDDGILQNFTGIDWQSNGAGWIQGFDLTGANTTGDSDTFSFTYQAFAAAINTTSPTPNLRVAPPGPAVGSYELTTFANITETATCLNVGCSSISIALNSGAWQVFFDISPDANQAAGTGFIDGVQILAGDFTAGLSTFIATGPIGPGSLGTGGGFLIGNVLTTNNAFVNPDLVGTTFQASLQFPGQNPPTYTRPVAFAGAPTGIDTGTDFVLQTDTSQDFSAAAIPEPATLSLLGLGLFAMGMLGRRKQS